MVYIVVLVLYFAFIIGTSLRSAKQVETMSDFTSGGNKMGIFLCVGTSLATWLSVASVMGVPGNIYSRGICAVFGWIAGWMSATALQPLLAYKIRRPEVPCRTFPEFMHLRYDPFAQRSAIQIFSAVIELVGYFVFSYIQVQGFGIVLSTITGLPYAVCCLAFMVLLIFTCMGGFKSVAATDTLNAALILVGVVAAMASVVSLCGGLGNIVTNFATTTAPTTVGGEPLEAGILGSKWGTFGASTMISYFLSNGLGSTAAPHWVARFMAPKNAKTAAGQMFWCLLILVLVFTPLIIVGMAGKMLMPSLPEGLSSDYMFPTLVKSYMNPVLGALSLTAICAAAVSTANSMLLHCATSLVYDIKRPLQDREASESNDSKTTKELRFVILGLGVIAVLCAIGQFSLLAEGFTYIYGAFGSVFFCSVWLGVYTKRMNNAAAFASMIVGLAAYCYCMAAGTPFGLPAFFFSCGCSLIAALIGMAAGKRPPLESYEMFFVNHASPSTLAAVRKIRKD